jgi:hypothetical protein
MLDEDVVPPGLLLHRQQLQIFGDISLLPKVEKRVATHLATGVAYAQKNDAEVQHVEQHDDDKQSDAAGYE